MFSSRAGYADALAGGYHSPAVYHDNPPPRMQRNGSVMTITTRPMSFSCGTGVSFERSTSGPTDDDIIMVTVRLSTKQRRQSYDEALPSRPPKRGFLRRMSTRILPPAEADKWTAVKMPRGEYKRHFVRDGNGNYAGSEPQRDWDEEDLKKEYAIYQDLPVGSVLM